MFAVPLKNENARPFGILRILFNHYSMLNANENFLDKDVVFGQFIVSMLRNTHVLTYDEVKNALKYLTHR